MTMPRNIMGSTESPAPKVKPKITSIVIELSREDILKGDVEPKTIVSDVVKKLRESFPGQIPNRQTNIHVADNVWSDNTKIAVDFE